eukprot:ctg_1213.g379
MDVVALLCRRRVPPSIRPASASAPRYATVERVASVIVGLTPAGVIGSAGDGSLPTMPDVARRAHRTGGDLLPEPTLADQPRPARLQATSPDVFSILTGLGSA